MLRGNVHPLARAAFDGGEVSGDLSLTRLLLVLKRSDAEDAALRRLIENQQSKGSAEYHHWRTPEQIAAEFGPADSDVSTVTAWLESQGFKVSEVSRGHQFIEFSGSAGLVKQAFGTAIHRYLVNGAEHFANATDPTIPAALAPAIAGIVSLHDFRRQAANHRVGQYSEQQHRIVGESGNPTPNETLGSEQYSVVPFDLATIYDVLPLWNASPTPINGTGQTIAVVARTDISPNDTRTFWKKFALDGTHAPQPTLNMIYNGPNPGINSDEAEGDIDSQWSGAVAPGATIDFVVSASTETTDGVDLSALYIVDNNLAPILTESYGACEAAMGSAGTQFYGALWEQAAAQGISVIVSTGDNAAAGCDDPSGPARHGLAVNGIASTPFNAAIGGTDFNQLWTWTSYWNGANDPVTSASAKGYIPETTWNDSCANLLVQSVYGGSSNPEANCNGTTFSQLLISEGASGGTSSAWLKPTWQVATPSDNARDLPDVSLFASNGFLGSYYVVCQSQDATGACETLAGYGGTSVAAPAFAGMMALVNQKTGSAQGVPGLVLYKLASSQPSAFHDVTGNNWIDVPCVTGTPNCTTATAGDAYGLLGGYSAIAGYDLATGLGSLDATNLVNNWSSVSFNPSTTSLTLNGGSVVSIAHGTAVPVAIQVSPTAATGAAVLMVSPGTPGDPGFATFNLSSGAASSSTKLLPGGSYSVLAHYGGDGSYGGSYSNAVPVTVTPEGSKTFADLVSVDQSGNITSYGTTSATYGSGWALLRVDVGDGNASYSPTSGIASTCASGAASCATGTVTLAASGTALDGTSLALNAKGNAETLPLVPGTYAVNASYGGDASYGPSVGATSFTIAKAPTQVVAALVGTPVFYGTPQLIDGTVQTTSDGASPTGTFQFTMDGNASGSPVGVWQSSGYNPQATSPYAWAEGSQTLTFLTVRSHTASVQYAGDANYAGSTSAILTVNVVKAPAYLGAVSWGTSSASLGQNVIVTGSLLGAPQGSAPTGTITFYDNGQPIAGTVTTTPTGTNGVAATIGYTFTQPGSHGLTVSYSGDQNYTSAATTIPSTINVLGPVTVTENTGVAISGPGSSGTGTLTVTSNLGFTGPVVVACTPDPKATETTCSLSSGGTSGSSIQINLGSAPVPVTITVNTTAATISALKTPEQGKGRKGLVLLGGLLVLLIPARRRRGILCGVLLIVTFGVIACGGGGNGGGGPSGGGGGKTTNPGTPAGSYSFVVTATTGSGASAVTSSTNVVVSVQ